MTVNVIIQLTLSRKRKLITKATTKLAMLYRYSRTSVCPEWQMQSKAFTFRSTVNVCLPVRLHNLSRDTWNPNLKQRSHPRGVRI